MRPVQYTRSDWCNDGDQTQEQSFEYKRTVTDSTTLTLSATLTLEIGVDLEVGTNIEIYTDKASFHFGMSLSLSVSYAQTHTTEQSMTSTQTIRVGPRSRAHTACWTNKGTVRSPFSMNVVLHGNVVWACTTRINYVNYVYAPNTWTMDKLRDNCHQWFGLSNEQFDEIRNKTIHGTLESTNGYDVECSNHVEHLKPGETCEVAKEKEIVV
eukprot:GEMP01048458.1.p1 GENE.GEMP01048458.1~~GEMP01048458.1.p1  ORF type:complete len:211 (+),score=18.28 GEMP01048458.1:607-1239(+)